MRLINVDTDVSSFSLRREKIRLQLDFGVVLLAKTVLPKFFPFQKGRPWSLDDTLQLARQVIR